MNHPTRLPPVRPARSDGNGPAQGSARNVTLCRREILQIAANALHPGEHQVEYLLDRAAYPS